METKGRPWGINRIGDLYDPQISAGLPDGRYVLAVAEPYDGNRLRAAWWVLTGRAFAFLWPEHGELEDAIYHKHRKRSALRAARGEQGEG